MWVSAGHADSSVNELRRLTGQLDREKDPQKKRNLESMLANTFAYAPGDLLAHEAWDVWGDMHLMFNQP